MNTQLPQKETGVPIPDPKRTNQKSAWDDLQIGESFFFSAEQAADKYRTRSCVTQAAVRCRQRHPGRKFTIRLVPDGVRVWRIA